MAADPMMNPRENDHRTIKIQILLHHLRVARALRRDPFFVVKDHTW